MTATDNKPSAELQAMVEIERILGDLEAEPCARVLRWATDRFNVSVESKPEDGPPPADHTSNPPGDGTPFDDLATLYNAAAPETDTDKALVAGYWFQFVKQEGEDLYSGRVNTELRHLGHAISNIARAFVNLTKTKPQLVIQTKKSGRARQARKRYRITTAGKVHVEAMLKGSQAQ